MGDSGPLRGRRLGRADAHAAIDLTTVAVNDFGAGERRREGNRSLRLAGRGGADDEDDFGLAAVEDLHRGYANARAMATKLSGWRLAPPTRAPSMSG